MMAAKEQNRTLGVYAYDTSGERVKKVQGDRTTYYITPDYELRDGMSTIYLRINGRRAVKIEAEDLAAQVLPDGNHDGVINAADAWFAIQNRTPIPIVQRMLAASAHRTLVGGEKVTYFHHNHLGSTVLTTDDTGEVVERTQYYPYGAVRASSTGLVADYSWAGQETDTGTELSYHSARYLDKRTGRWASADPLFETLGKVSLEKVGELNRYGFAAGDPINSVDPSGQYADTNNAVAGAINRVLKFAAHELDRAAKFTGDGPIAELNSAVKAIQQGNLKQAVGHLIVAAQRDLHIFIRRWRRHFIESMQPQYLP
jgi:RHS repeat-associated protein